ncbi:hypothetical protein DdX_21908 [Ditylenchus destructor]|uniref:Uncharacterized protein n=1 Tax=Ditylenchus destructor TaxID=166010 RepID=A0AAD4MEZ8_9BILA|nr:hypothetical protein DdX_21908 [Ditylenchus destructor]
MNVSPNSVMLRCHRRRIGIFEPFINTTLRVLSVSMRLLRRDRRDSFHNDREQNETSPGNYSSRQRYGEKYWFTRSTILRPSFKRLSKNVD